MKKIIYSLLIACAASLAITSCSEEEIKPQTEGAQNGGVGQADKGF